MSESPFIRKYALPVAAMIVGVLLIIWPSLYNGYPLFYSDTGTYLRSSVLMEPPIDRPIGYGMFIRLVSWEATLWTIVIFQGLIVYWLTARVVRLYFSRPYIVHLGILAVLSVSSSLPWYAAQVMPDIFSGVVILAVFLYFFDTPNWKLQLTYGLTIGFFTLSHYSFFVIVFLTASLIAVIRVRKIFTTEKRFLYKYLSLQGFLAAAVLFVMTFNYNHEGEFRFSFASNVFLTAKFTDGDILTTYLKDNCGKKDIPFCQLKDSTLEGPMAFLWNDNYPFQKDHMGWRETNEKCAVIVHDVFTTAKYRNLFLKEAWRATLDQLKQNKIGSGLTKLSSKNGAPGDMIYSDFRSEFYAFQSCRQNNEDMEDLTINRFGQDILIFCTLIILFGLCYRPLRHKLGVLMLVCLFGVVFNAFVTAALANVYNRLQARVTWLLVFGALIILAYVIMSYIDSRRIKNSESL